MYVKSNLFNRQNKNIKQKLLRLQKYIYQQWASTKNFRY